MIYREQLDGMTCQGCDDPDCSGGALWLHSRCHETSPTWSIYEDGVLRVVCSECEAVIAEIAVASVGSTQ